MAGAQAGVVGQVTVDNPQGSPGKTAWSPSTWTFIWFGLAVAIVFGFHIRILGATIPPQP